VTSPRAELIGVGPLTAKRVLDDARGMLRQSFWRIAGVAIVFFAPPALIAGAIAVAIESVEPETSPLAPLVVIIAALVGVSLRVLGPVAFAGFLDEAVAKEYLHGRHHRLLVVLRDLPWRPLVIADLVVVLAVGLGLALFIVPGLIAFGLLAMVGPVIVQEQAGVASSFRRTIRLTRSAPRLVAVLVVAPFAVEEILHEIIHHTLHTSGFGPVVVGEWLVAILVGGALGLSEVALATELMARNPREAADSVDAGGLLDDGQASTV
jgi:hypothetical protein